MTSNATLGDMVLKTLAQRRLPISDEQRSLRGRRRLIHWYATTPWTVTYQVNEGSETKMPRVPFVGGKWQLRRTSIPFLRIWKSIPVITTSWKADKFMFSTNVHGRHAEWKPVRTDFFNVCLISNQNLWWDSTPKHPAWTQPLLIVTSIKCEFRPA